MKLHVANCILLLLREMFLSDMESRMANSNEGKGWINFCTKAIKKSFSIKSVAISACCRQLLMLNTTFPCIEVY